MQRLLTEAADDLTKLMPAVVAMGDKLAELGKMLIDCWAKRGKVMVAGNGGSAADAMHLAEEFSVRFMKNRRALAAIALCDPTAITCAGNDFGYEHVFSRQVEALGNPGDVLIVFSTSGNSPSILRAVELARKQGLNTVAFLGKDGGQAKGKCDMEFIIPSNFTPRIQESHKLLYHVLCDWVDKEID